MTTPAYQPPSADDLYVLGDLLAITPRGAHVTVTKSRTGHWQVRVYEHLDGHVKKGRGRRRWRLASKGGDWNLAAATTWARQRFLEHLARSPAPNPACTSPRTQVPTPVGPKPDPRRVWDGLADVVVGIADDHPDEAEQLRDAAALVREAEDAHLILDAAGVATGVPSLRLRVAALVARTRGAA